MSVSMPRQRELSEAQARQLVTAKFKTSLKQTLGDPTSHAAALYKARAMRQALNGVELKPTRKSAKSGWSKSAGAREKRTEKKPIESLSQPSPLRMEIDSFSSIPFDIATEDKHLLHTYHLATATQIYGTNENPIFSSARDLVLKRCHTAPLVLEWTLVSAEAFYARRRGQSPDGMPSQRTAHAYRALNQHIAESQGKITDELISGITMAIVTEARLRSPAVARLHLRAHDQLIEMRGGIDAMLTEASDPWVMSGEIMPYVVCEPEENSHSSDLSVATALRTLEIDHSDPQLHQLLRDNNIRLLLSSKWLMPFLASRTWDDLTFPQKSSHFTALYLIIAMLWRLRDDLEYARFAIARVHHILSQSTGLDAQGQVTLTLPGFMWVTIKAVFDVVWVIERFNAVKKRQIQEVIAGIKAAKLFRRMSDQTRSQTVDLFCQLLRGDNLDNISLSSDE